MKLKDITTGAFNSDSATLEDECGLRFGAERNAAYPELAELLIARAVNGVMNCRLLARDELELANLVLNRMDVDPHYIPSCIVLDAVRAINAKLAQCAASTANTRSA